MHEDPTLEIVSLVVALMFTASVVAVLAKRIRFPYTIFLVVIGLLAGWLSGAIELLKPLTHFELTPEVIVFVFLPVLIFESAFNLNARALFKNLPPILTLAIPALLVSTAIVGSIVHLALKLPWDVSLLFGALISATDPVAVISLFKEMGAPKRLTVLVEGESLFNDGTALVLFKILLGIVIAGHFSSATIAHGFVDFLIVFLGGLAVGGLMGYVFSRAIEMVENDALIEITLTTLLAHSTFILAEHYLHVSGVMATVAAGLTLGSYGRNKISPPVLEHMEHFWEYFAYVCNSLIFLLVGLSVDLPLFFRNLGSVAWAVAAVLFARAFVVYTFTPVAGRLRGVEKIDRKFQTVIFWGGLRGALAVAMVLSIPADVAQRPFLIVLTIGIVLFTLIVNGLSIRPLMSLLGLDRYSTAERFERSQAMLRAKQETIDSVEGFGREGEFDPKAVGGVASGLRREMDEARAEVSGLREGEERLGAGEEREVVMRQALLLEKAEYHELFESGLISEENLRDFRHTIDLALDRVKEQGGVKTMGRGLEDFFGGREAILFKLIGATFLLRLFLRRYKTGRIAASYERKRARLMAYPSVIEALREMGMKKTYDPGAVEEAVAFYGHLKELTEERVVAIKAEFPEYVEKVEEGILRRYCLSQELKAYEKLFEEGGITDKVLKEFRARVSEEMRKMRTRPVEELLIPAPKLMGMVPYFSEFPEEDLKRITSHVKVHSFLPAEDIVCAGEAGSSLFIIGRGRAEVFTPEGRSIAMLKAGDFFGEFSLLEPQPRSATVRAVTPCTLLELRREVLVPYLDEAPHLKETLETTYRKRLAELRSAKKP
jgi:CPA1 family monovalent cation:H+ antiporter